MEPINVHDYAELARERLPRMAYDYYASGAHDEITLARNERAYDEIALHYRVLVDASQPNLSTSILGHAVSMPLLVAPTAFHKMAHPDGELGTAMAVRDAESLMILSTLSTTSVEDVAHAIGGPFFFQLYVYKDREATRALVQRAEAAGARALVLTVDTPYLGVRERDVRNGFQLPDGLMAANLVPAGMESLPDVELESGLAAYIADLMEPALTYELLDWLCSITDLPVLVKGVVRADDAVRCVGEGAKGVIVSNHGGRQLDTAPATIEALPRIAEAVGDRAEVLLDGGVRRGTDVIKAVAMGAKAVCVGRPVLWGLAVDGQQGVARVLDILRREISLGMSLCGCPDIASITSDLITGP